jgi:2Fe-2S ferredoxin
MPKITFLPMNTVFDVAAGETVLDIAISHDVPLQHACGGFCACTTCHLHVISGAENLSEKEEDELERLDYATDVTETSRLGCQAKVMGDVVVQIVNVDERF